MKFTKGEVWKMRDTSLWVVTEIRDNGNYPVRVVPIEEYKNNFPAVMLTKYGYETSQESPGPYDAIKKVGHIKNYPEYLL